MIRLVRTRRTLTILLSVILLLSTVGSLSVDAQRRYRRYHRVHHSRTKGALIGAGVGTVGGAVIGGGKGALIGAGAGAGTGYLIQRYRNHKHRRHYRNR